MATFFKDNPNPGLTDLNRYRKVYRYIRKKPKPQTFKEDEISHFPWGTFFVEFNNQTSVTHTFPICFKTAPVVIATSVSTGVGTGNINAFITAISTRLKKAIIRS